MTGQPSNPYAAYDQMAHENHWYPEALFGLCYEYLQPGQRLLDVGAGTGLASEMFARAGLQVFGFDSSDEMLALFRAKGIAAELRQHDLTRLPWPYPDLAFDHILAGGVLHFLAELEPVFREVSRLLRPGGVFACTTKAPTGSTAWPFQVEEIQGTPLYLHQPAALQQMLAGCGLAVRKELRLLITTGRATDDVFLAWVIQKPAGPSFSAVTNQL